MINIKTLVYFDLEATGLKSAGRPRVTEFAFVAVNFEDVEELHIKIHTKLGLLQTLRPAKYFSGYTTFSCLFNGTQWQRL